jgi:hypothetical protein
MAPLAPGPAMATSAGLRRKSAESWSHGGPIGPLGSTCLSFQDGMGVWKDLTEHLQGTHTNIYIYICMYVSIYIYTIFYNTYNII